MSTGTFERFVCWDSARAQHVMNTEALQTPNEVFLATHHPVRMYKQELRQPDSRVAYDQEALLRDFLAPAGYSFVPVLGSAGTGKSHLVRWLWLNVPEEERRKVVLIPRGGTNLRGVIELILRDMEGPKFDNYRDRLRQATTNLTVSQARHVLLDNLALACGPDGTHTTETLRLDAETREAYEHFRTYLPALLRDDFFRSQLLADGGIVDQLARHVIGSMEVVERREQRRLFSASDLPSITDYDKAGASARHIFGELAGDDWLKEKAIDFLNQHLEDAIGRLLQLGGADLTRLMRDVRAELADQSLELIILIEDFARLQGIGRQLLDALLEQPNQPDVQLCALRTAIACTTSYFEKVEDTVRQRTTFVVSLDRELAVDGGVVTKEDFEEFAARYLNAARLSEKDLRDWYRRRRRTGRQEPIPSGCAICAFSGECHEAFGARNGMGLYPFNATALREMYARVGADGFSPRFLITDVLRRTLVNYGGAIAEGTFPPTALVAGLGGSHLPAAVRAEITSRDPVHASRREVFVELWSGGQLVDLDPTVHRAFGLPALRTERETRPKQPVPIPPPMPQPQTTASLSRSIEEALLALDRWQNGAVLPQSVTNDLREGVYYAIENRIDWDSALLLKGEFASATSTAPFRQRSINFKNQATQKTTALVQLTLPLTGSDLTRTALALQGLLLFTHFGHWNFEWGGRTGSQYQRDYACALERWAESVLYQIRCAFLPEGRFDPVPAAVELLALSSRLAVGISPLRPTREELVDSVFRPVAKTAFVGRAPSWAELGSILADQREMLMNMVSARVAATKGTDRRFSVVDSARFLDVLQVISTEWKPQSVIPAELPAGYFDGLRRAREAVDRLLDSAIEEERERHVASFDAVVQQLGSTDDHKVIVDAVRAAAKSARDGGVFIGSADAFDQVVQNFRSSAFVSWRDSVEKVREETDRRQLIGLLSQDHQKAASAAKEFVDAVDRFLSRAQERVDSEIRDLELQGGRDLEECLRVISASFEGLQSAISQIAGVPT